MDESIDNIITGENNADDFFGELDVNDDEGDDVLIENFDDVDEF